MKNHNVGCILIVMMLKLAFGEIVDYWDGDFDENKNCEKEELIGKLSREEQPGRCASKTEGNVLSFYVSKWSVSLRKRTSTEDELNQSQPKQKMTLTEEDLNGR